MDYLLFDKLVYYNIQGKQGSVEEADVHTLFAGSTKELSIAIVDTSQKVVVAPSDNEEKKQEIIEGAYSEDYLIQSEQIGNNLYQVIGVKKEKIDQVYKLLEGENVKKVIPYGLAIRALLKKLNFIDKERSIIFLDKISNYCLLTILGENRFTSVRRLALIPQGRLCTDLKRREQNYRNEHRERGTKEIRFMVLSNDRNILDEIITEGIHPKEDTAYIEASCPAIAGLAGARFSMHFMLPEMVFKLRRAKEIKKNLFYLIVSGAVVALGVGILLFSLVYKRMGELRLQRSTLERVQTEERLRELNARRYKDILFKRPKIDFAVIVGAFLDSLPEGVVVEKIDLKKVGVSKWVFEGIVYLGETSVMMEPFKFGDIFKEARVEDILVNRRAGKRIVLEIRK